MNWIIFLIVLVAIIGWFAWSYFSVRRAAKFIDNAEFESMLHTSQVIDVREAAAFKAKHIMGARNLPASQIQMSYTAIRKDKPVLLYDSSRSAALPRVIKMLKKAGYTDLYVLKDGFDYWTGKIKEG
ncbi:rhodanese-like domain-containing protein [Streptococcus equinus]|uniref:Rhodanese-like protein n=1 Tax=Streptococcus equinus ATCC 9812 TaxID=525379 RepID=E8JM18_STREI|nr:rhodanese-like domain-containing protein [Streptococcus equinus]EFW89761.1 rhodanese-like protein [Streptococcus equinus ATCC 9812]UOC11652.1 rhodanese-like domain-containing protein [Streptococcus equinus]SDI53641.1 Rhodanese-related sulfurtransferase [Streptococcus equinus]SEP66954.1 Rhodanese-related sulfurtransferase [Streptococcus equinus]SUN56441.1 Rhodanese-related sulfur transferase [Streptococcus equinus]